MERETATWTCPNCRIRNRTLADEAGDHPCGRCGWEPYAEREAEDEFVNESEDEE